MNLKPLETTRIGGMSKKNALLALARTFGKLNTLLSIITGWLLFVMTGIVFYAVILRYFFGMPPMWTKETSTFMLLFITFIPLGFVMQHDRHMTVDILMHRMSKKTLRILNICNALLAAALFILLAWQGAVLTAMAFRYHWVSMEMNIPLGYPYLILPIGCGLMTVSCLFKVVEQTRPEESRPK